MQRAQVDQWLGACVEAWRHYDRDQIGELFAEDVQYRYHPCDEPVRGRAAVVRSWMGLDAGAALISPSGHAAHITPDG